MPKHPLSLHHIVAPEVDPVAFVGIARALECPHVCLWTQGWIGAPGQDAPAEWRFRVVEAADVAGVRDAMRAEGVSAYAVTSFPVRPNVEVSDYEPALERGALLGASYVSTSIFEPDESRAIDQFARLGELAQRHGLTASIEGIGFKAPEILDRALHIIQTTGFGLITIDPLHITRSSASMDTLRRIAPASIGYVQFCDGPLHTDEAGYWREAAEDRLAPGEGEFPLPDFLALLPDGRPISLEVPTERMRKQGMSPEARCRSVIDATHRFFERNDVSWGA